MNFLVPFYEFFSTSDYVARSDDWWKVGKHCERSRHGLIDVASQHLPGEAEENHEGFLELIWEPNW